MKVKYICEHRVKVTDKQGNVNYMDCGHCEVCMRKKVNRYFAILNQVVYNYKHALFIHPTYDDDFLPRAEFVFRPTCIELVSRCDRMYNEFGETDFVLKSFDPTRENIELIDNYLNKFSHRRNYGKEIGILNYKDVQLFFKNIRNRYYRETKNRAEFKYFCVCEYGGNYKRPHYHILLLTNDSNLVAWLYDEKRYTISSKRADKHLHDCWGLGFIELQRVESVGKSASYISSYVVTAGADLSILNHSQVRPSFKHSAGLWSTLVDDFRPFFNDYVNMSWEELREAYTYVNGIPTKFLECLPALNSLYRQPPMQDFFTSSTLHSFCLDCKKTSTKDMIQQCLNHEAFEWIYNYCNKEFKFHRYANNYRSHYQMCYAFNNYVKGFIYKLRHWYNNYIKYHPVDYSYLCRYLRRCKDIELYNMSTFYSELEYLKQDVSELYYIQQTGETDLARQSFATCRLSNQEARFKKLHVNKVFELSSIY